MVNASGILRPVRARALAMMHAHRITGTKFGSRPKEGQGRTECVIGGSA
jgi:hypothetical protein